MQTLLAKVTQIVEKWPHPVYLVGGAVRDVVLNRPIHDLDFVTGHNAIRLAFWVADKLRVPAYVLDQERDVGRVMIDEETSLDFARFRTDNHTFGKTLEVDLRARDFTINALAQELKTGNTTIIDPTGGLQDLERGVVRMAYAEAIEEDPARALRALRMALQFGFEMEPATYAAVEKMAGQLWRISAERVRDEFLKLLMLPNPHRAVALLHDTGLLQDITPELIALVGLTQSPPHHEPVFEHTQSVLRWLVWVESTLRENGQAILPHFTRYEQLFAYMDRRVDGGFSGWQLLRLAGLFHDIGKAQTRTVEESGRIRFLKHEKVGADLVYERLRQLKFSKAANDTVRGIVKGHMRPFALADQSPISRRSVYRYFKATGGIGVDIALLSLADNLAKDNGVPSAQGETKEAWEWLCQVIDKLLTENFAKPEKSVRPPKLVTGGDVMQTLGIGPGREIGRILEAITEAQAAGEIETREQALDAIRVWKP
ncbi:MAG: CCA tRNA nucleotidyltransferase [Candidatus Promineifilaceae bacterium]